MDNNLSNVDNKLLIFLHIPKTGGTTLTEIISRQYPNNIIYLADKNGVLPSGVLSYKEELKTSNSICGHFLFGAHNYISRPSNYITMLRNPIEQVISWFYFKYKNDQYEQFEGSLEEYISSNKFDYFTVNIQTRFICGGGSIDLEKAKHNLIKYFSIVGITELFDESIFLMKKDLEWKNIDYKRLNINKSRLNKKQIPKSIINKIKEKNKMDIELYDFATKIIKSKIEDLDVLSKGQLKDFKSSHMD